MTFFAPPPRCLAASSRLVKKPVDSSTTSAPRSPHGSAAGSRLGEHLEAVAVDHEVVAVDLDRARVRAEDRVVLEQVGERLRVGEVVDGDEVDVGAGRLGGAEEVAADAAEAVDADAYGHGRNSLGCRAQGKIGAGRAGRSRRERLERYRSRPRRDVSLVARDDLDPQPVGVAQVGRVVARAVLRARARAARRRSRRPAARRRRRRRRPPCRRRGRRCARSPAPASCGR